MKKAQLLEYLVDITKSERVEFGAVPSVVLLIFQEKKKKKMLFYSNADEATDFEKPSGEPEGIERVRLQTELLPNGNQVMESPQLTDKIHEWRNGLIYRYNSLEAEWSNLKSATKNEIATSEEYLDKNIFQDPYENGHLVVPSAILSLGAFFCGRVLTNRSNWGHASILRSTPSMLGRIFTSLPSRVFLPVALAITVFGQVTPATTRNAWNTIERDVLPDSFVSDSRRLWNEWYAEGLKKGSHDLGESIQSNLQYSIRRIRESIKEVSN